MKVFGLIILTIFISIPFGQTQTSLGNLKNPVSVFKLSLTTLNHATMLFDGETTYILTNKSIEVRKTPFGEKKGKVIFYKSLLESQNSYAIVNNLGLDTLEGLYDNYCIMETSGNEYFLNYKSHSTKKHISLHHYYLKQVADIANLINSYLPQNFQFRYLQKDNRQDCSPL